MEKKQGFWSKVFFGERLPEPLKVEFQEPAQTPRTVYSTPQARAELRARSEAYRGQSEVARQQAAARRAQSQQQRRARDEALASVTGMNDEIQRQAVWATINAEAARTKGEDCKPEPTKAHEGGSHDSGKTHEPTPSHSSGHSSGHSSPSHSSPSHDHGSSHSSSSHSSPSHDYGSSHSSSHSSSSHDYGSSHSSSYDSGSSYSSSDSGSMGF